METGKAVERISEADFAHFDRLLRKIVRLRQLQAEVARLQAAEPAMAEMKDHLREVHNLRDDDYVRDDGEIIRIEA